MVAEQPRQAGLMRALYTEARDSNTAQNGTVFRGAPRQHLRDVLRHDRALRPVVVPPAGGDPQETEIFPP